MKKFYYVELSRGVKEEISEGEMISNDVYDLEEVRKKFDFNFSFARDLPHYELVNEIDEDVSKIEKIYLPLSSIQKIHNYLSEEEIKEILLND